MTAAIAWHLAKRALSFALMGALLCGVVGAVNGAFFGAVCASLLGPSNYLPLSPQTRLVVGAATGSSFGLILSAAIGSVAWSIIGVLLPPLRLWLDVMRAMRWRIWTWPLIAGASGAISGVGAGILSNFLFHNARDWPALGNSAFDYGYFYGCIAGHALALFAAILTGGLSASRRPNTP